MPKKKNIEDAIIQSFQALYFPQQTDLVRKMGFNLIKEQLILLSGSISDTRKKSCFNVIMSLGNLKSNFTSKFSAPFFSGAQLQPLKYHNICKGKTSLFKTLSFIFLIRRWIPYSITATWFSTLHPVVSIRYSVGLQVLNVKKTVSPYGLALALCTFLAIQESNIFLSVERDLFFNPSLHVESIIPWWAQYQ